MPAIRTAPRGGDPHSMLTGLPVMPNDAGIVPVMVGKV
jgi:hypothetical protein